MSHWEEIEDLAEERGTLEQQEADDPVHITKEEELLQVKKERRENRRQRNRRLRDEFKGLGGREKGDSTH